MPETEMVPVPNSEGSEETKKTEAKEEPTDDQEAKKENINGVGGTSPTKEESEEKSGSDQEKSSSSTEDEENEKWKFKRNARNRVKLYVLCEQRVWDDRGTGHVACLPVPDQEGFYAIVVRLESNGLKKNVLESKVLLDTVYQKQQETLIVWSESETTDLALSFQEKSGCEELWNKICEVQGKDPKECMNSLLTENDDNDEGESSEGVSNDRGNGEGSVKGLTLPSVDVARLHEIEFLFTNNCNSAVQKERFANAIERQDYVTKLCDVFKMCEDIEHMKGLRSCYQICRAMFQLNKNSAIEALVHEDNLKAVVGMLEFDPVNVEPKPHREFLYEKARFREIIPLENEILREKIHQAYRVQYVQDVCLPAPSLFEENNLSALNSYIFFLRVDIVTLVQENQELMTTLFTELNCPSTPLKRRKELSGFLKELCAMSGTLQQGGPQSKEQFYKMLLQHDLLKAIEPTFRSASSSLRSLFTEILQMVVEQNGQVVRDFLITQSKDKKDNDMLLSMLLNHIVTDSDPELTSATQMLQIMRLLLDPEHMAQKGDKNEFLTLFYNKCLPCFTANLIDVVNGVSKPKKDDYHTAKKLSLVLRLLNFCVGHHALPMRMFIIRRDFLNKVLVLLSSRHHFLALYALKLLRSVLQQKDEYYYNYITDKNVFDKVVECLIDIGNRNNLLNSALIEIFEYMRQEDMKVIINHVVERHIETLLTHGYVKTFRELKLRYDQAKEREELMRKRDESSSGRRETEKWKNREREIEKEEQWFDDDEDEEEEEKKEREREKREERSKAPGPSPGRKSGAEPMFMKMRPSKAADEEEGVFGGSSGPRLGAALAGLANAPKMTIKVVQEGSRSRSPSPGSVPREDEVSSSQASSSSSSPAPASPSGAIQKRPSPGGERDDRSPTPKKGLVEYDDSDSDEEGGEGGERGDAVPSSSTRSPSDEKEEGEEGEGGEGKRKREGMRREEEEDEDVSSTSGDDDRATPAADAVAKKSRKRESADCDDVSSDSGKRIRVDEEEEVVAAAAAAGPTPPPVDAQ